MPDYDGSIKLGVELDATTVIKSSSRLKSEISDIFKQTAGKHISEEMQRIKQQMDSAVTTAARFEAKMKELKSVPLPEYGKLEDELVKVVDDYQTLINAQKQLSDAGVGPNDSRMQEINSKIESVKESMVGIAAEMEKLESLDQAFTFANSEDAAAYDDYKNKLVGVNNQMRILIASAYKTGEAIDSTHGTFRTLQSIAKSTAKKVASVFKAAGSKIKDVFKKAFDSIKSHSAKTFSSVGGNISRTIKQFLALGIGITGVVALFRKMRSAATEGLQAMALLNGGNNSVNQSISMLISSLNYLKASLATAFAPILTVVAPILSAFVDMLARAAQMVAAFFAALTGKSTYSVATKTNTNYAASISKSTGSTKKDTKETKKNTKAKKDNAKATKDQNDKLADFDDLNVLGAEAQDDLNDAIEDQPEIETPEIETPSGGGGGGGSPLAQFDERQIPDWVKNLVDKIKDAWKNADFTEIGRMVGEKLRDALNKAADWLVQVAQPIAEKIGKSIATFLNGFFETPGLATALGRAIGELINTAVIGVNAFLDNTHFQSIGKFIADSLNSAIRTIDWKAIGHLFAQGINALSGMLLGFVKNFDFKGFGTSLANGLMQAVRDIDMKQIFEALSGALAGILEFLVGAVEGLDWKELGSTLLKWIVDAITGIDWARVSSAWFELLGAALGAVASFAVGLGTKLWELLVAAYGSIKALISQKTKEVGGNIILGVFAGILSIISGVSTWIKQNIFDPFINGFKAAFGIASPSKVMEEQGTFLMEGLFNGISNFIAKIVELFNTLKNAIIQKWEELRTGFLTLTENIKIAATQKWNEFKTGVETLINTFKSNVIKFVTTLRDKFLELTTDLKTKALEIWNAIRTKIEELVTKLKENVINFITDLRDTALRIFEALKRTAIQLWTELKNTVEGLVNKFKETIIGYIKDMHDRIIGPDGWLTKLKTGFIEAWEKIQQGIEKPINGIKDMFKSIGDAAKDGINAAIDALNGLNIKIPDWVPGIGGSEWSPDIPKLAQGAVIPPNKEFLAVLGDQRQGTNIEAPLDTIVQAMQMALSSTSAQNSSQNAIMTLDGQTFARLIVPHVMDELNRRGYDVSVLEG